MRWPWQRNSDTVVVSSDWFMVTKYKNTRGPNSISLEFTKPWMRQLIKDPIRMTEHDAAQLSYALGRVICRDT